MAAGSGRRRGVVPSGTGIALLLGATFLLAAAASAADLSPREKAGRRLFRKMESQAGARITAYVGKESMQAPGGVFPCVNCHDLGGRGKIEAGVAAPDITWTELTKPYGASFEGGRRRPAYTEESLRRAIAEGVDPGGNRLDPVMPRYRMTEQDMAFLVAFLRRLGTETEPGLTRDAILVGTLLPSGGPLAGPGESMRRVLAAYFGEVNEGGGVYGRRIELVVGGYGGPGEAVLAAARGLVREREVFALVSGFTIGADREVAALSEEEEVPLVGPYTLVAQETLTLNRYSFYLYSGLEQQAAAFLAWAGRELVPRPGRVAIVHEEGRIPGETLTFLEERAGRAGFGTVDRIPLREGEGDPRKLFGPSREEMPGVVLFLGPWEEARRLFAYAAQTGWAPHLFLPGSRVGKDVFDLPGGFRGTLHLSYPTRPSDAAGPGGRELGNLQGRHGIPRDHLTAQVAAYAAARVLTEALKTAGKELDRETLILRLEKIYRFDTGVTPPVTFGPNRRVGALGAHLVRVDPEGRTFVPEGGFVELEER